MINADNSSVPTSSSPVAALRYIFNSPNWIMNVVWMSLAALSSGIFVGQIAALGYGTELIQRNAAFRRSESMDVDIDRLGDYISKGIWPYLVHLAIGFLFSILLALPLAGIFVFGALGLGAAAGEAGIAFAPLFFIPIALAISTVLSIASIPFILRSMVCQDFLPAFDVGWALEFVSKMFWEILVSGIIFGILSMAILFAGLLLCGVGYFPACGIVLAGAMHMLAQWYEIFLSRGGTPIPPSDSSIVEASIL
ncbi:DUF4013 domain-containing protein [Aureliella helgolandensis]|uniref:DUF4013 domain-containing protein n=1 Tax=Aureliella helgolandensis TaxID=2527968 RepID=A0A518G4Z5_9BACT|nr:DUF4013 domain-containing protein [Aureliella helgolandensis]QDV23668.1 hypothetical protein Q31a_19730 [Aureliella helgolandensis]